MSAFDKLCSLLTIPIGLVFMVLGVVGLFTGSSAQFTLPPVLGGLPFLLGWAMFVVPLKLWARSNRTAEDLVAPFDEPAEEIAPADEGAATR